MITSLVAGRQPRKRGNVLIMAICICVFVFFLAVALTAENRQLVIFTLGEENRLRANNAVNSALDVALHQMRTNAAWENGAWAQSGVLPSGGEWKILSLSRLKAQPQLIFVEAQGTSGMVTAKKTRIIEEIKMCNDLQTGPNYFFAKDEIGSLYALDPDFTWQQLGALPNDDTRLAANAGPLFATGLQQANPLPTIDDAGKPASLKVVPASTLLTLVCTDSSLEWKNIPASNSERYSSLSAKNPTIIENKLFRQTAATTEGTVYRGGCVEWYNQTGQALYAQNDTVYTHAFHYYYKGCVGVINAKGLTITEPATLYQARAVLAYNLDTSLWTTVIDQMTVSSLGSTPSLPTSSDAVSPNCDTLAVVNGACYAFQQGKNELILKGSKGGWTPVEHTTSGSLNLAEWDKRLVFLTQGKSSSSGGSSGYYNDLNIGTSLVNDLRITRPKVSLFGKDALEDSVSEMDTLEAVDQVPSISVRADGGTTVCTSGEDLYAVVNIGTRQALAHWNGSVWQLWPNGFHDLVTQTAEPTETSKVLQVSPAVSICPYGFAAAHYDEQTTIGTVATPRLSRYSVLVDTI